MVDTVDEVAAGTTSGYIVPTYQQLDFTITVDDVLYILDPMLDLTPVELFFINKWTREVEINMGAFNAQKFIERAEELGISRHFKEVKS